MSGSLDRGLLSESGNGKQEPKGTPTWGLNCMYFLHEGARMLLLRFMTAYFARAGFETYTIGLLQVTGTLMSFFGELTWAYITDKCCEFRRTVLCCNFFGIIFFLCIPFAPHPPHHVPPYLLFVLYG